MYGNLRIENVKQDLKNCITFQRIFIFIITNHCFALHNVKQKHSGTKLLFIRKTTKSSTITMEIASIMVVCVKL